MHCAPTIFQPRTSAWRSPANQINPVGTEKSAPTNSPSISTIPQAVADFNNLPVKVVNGTVVFMRDVAYVTMVRRHRRVVQLDGPRVF